MKYKFEVESIEGKCSNGTKIGDYFMVEGTTISIPEGKKICIWALNKILPVLPLLHEKKDLRKEHWIHETKALKCYDGKVKFAIKEVK